MIPIDLDGIDMTRAADYIRIVVDFLKLDKDKTGVFNSGHGLHPDYPPDSRIESVEILESLQPYYTTMSDKITQLIYDAGLPGKSDPVRLAESATLRLPLTINRKEDKGTNCTARCDGDCDSGERRTPTVLYGPHCYTAISDGQDRDSSVEMDTTAVLAGCDFLKHCFNNQATISEPEWYSMLGTLAFIEIGDDVYSSHISCHWDYFSGSVCLGVPHG